MAHNNIPEVYVLPNNPYLNNSNNNQRKITDKGQVSVKVSANNQYNNLLKQKANEEKFKKKQLEDMLNEFSRQLKQNHENVNQNSSITKENFGIKEFPILLEKLKQDDNMLLIEKKLALIEFFQQTLDNYKISNQDISDAAKNFLEKINKAKVAQQFRSCEKDSIHTVSSFNQQKSLHNLYFNKYFNNKENVRNYLSRHIPSSNMKKNSLCKETNEKINNETIKYLEVNKQTSVVLDYERILKTIIDNFSPNNINNSTTIIKPVEANNLSKKESVETTDIFRNKSTNEGNNQTPYDFTAKNKLFAALQKLDLNDISNFIIIFFSFFFSIVRKNYAIIKRYVREKKLNNKLVDVVLKKELYTYLTKTL
jgi:hypothetical protein